MGYWIWKAKSWWNTPVTWGEVITVVVAVELAFRLLEKFL